MKGYSFKLIFEANKAYLVEGFPIDLSQLVNLPDYATHFKPNVYWVIKVHSFNSVENTLNCDISSYKIGETSFDSLQSSLANQLKEVKCIYFKSIDTIKLLNSLDLKSNIKNINTSLSKEELELSQKRKKTITETFKVPIKKIRFIHGGVTFSKSIEEINKTIEFTITNYEIREEFDAVKNYFSKALGTKTIEVSTNIEVFDNEILSKEAYSKDIKKIDNKLIESVKFEYISNTTKKKLDIEIDKSLFTMDEYFDTFSDDSSLMSSFYENETQLFEDLLNIKNTKHYKNLRYLSNKHANQVMKLRFIHKPFSFIFLIKGNKHYHIVWETLDTEEATYLWRVKKDVKLLKRAIEKIEDIINVIKIQGKTAYINSTEDKPRRIIHDYSNFTDGFIKWKGEIESTFT